MVKALTWRISGRCCRSLRAPLESDVHSVLLYF